MTTFPIDKYENDPNVKWIVAQRSDGGEWVGRFLGTGDHYPTLDRVLDETPIGELRRSEFAVMKNNLTSTRYFLYWRGPEVHAHLGAALGNMINSVNSDFTINVRRS